MQFASNYKMKITKIFNLQLIIKKQMEQIPFVIQHKFLYLAGKII